MLNLQALLGHQAADMTRLYSATSLSYCCVNKFIDIWRLRKEYEHFVSDLPSSGRFLNGRGNSSPREGSCPVNTGPCDEQLLWFRAT